jgi:transposase
MKTYAGIDISKDSFVVAIPQEASYKKFKTKVYKNNPLGVKTFIGELPEDVHCVLEATGTYSLLLAYSLADSGKIVSVINPKAFKHFFILQGQTQKTDCQDAKTLSLFGLRMEPKIFKPKNCNILIIKQKIALLGQLKKQKAALKNFLESLQQHPYKDASSEKIAEDNIQHLKTQIDKVQAEITNLSKEDFEKQYELLTSIPAVGERLATSIITATNGFQAFENFKQFSKFIGISPTYFQSGTSLNMKGQINRSGDPQFRALLYMCALPAIQFNPICKKFYERLKERGKPSMVALIAVMNKLVKIMFGVVKSGKPFNANHCSNHHSNATN